MKKKLTILLTFFLVLSIAISITVCAQILDYTKNTDSNEEIIDTKEKTMLYKDDQGVELTLTYIESEQVGDRLLERYEDNSGNEYVFDKNGDIVGITRPYTISDELSLIMKGQEKEISKAEAKTIAEKYANDILGKKFKDYRFSKIYKDDSTYSYTVFYNIYFGEEAFIKVRGCTLSIGFDGNVNYITTTDSSIPEGFDTNLLEDLKEDDVTSYVLEKSKEICTAENVTHKILYYKPNIIDGVPYLTADVQVRSNDESAIFIHLNKVDYKDIIDYNGPSVVGFYVHYPLS